MGMMLTAFDYMTNAIFSDPNIGVDAELITMRMAAPQPIRVLLRSPDEIADWNGGSFVVGTVLLEIRIVDVPDLAEADTIRFGGKTYTIRGVPQKDAEGLSWLAQASEI